MKSIYDWGLMEWVSTGAVIGGFIGLALFGFNVGYIFILAGCGGYGVYQYYPKMKRVKRVGGNKKMLDDIGEFGSEWSKEEQGELRAEEHKGYFEEIKKQRRASGRAKAKRETNKESGWFG